MKLKYIPLVAFSGYTIRLIIFGASIGDALALLSFASLCAFFYFLEDKKEAPINDSLKNEIEQIKSTVNALKISKSLGR